MSTLTDEQIIEKYYELVQLIYNTERQYLFEWKEGLFFRQLAIKTRLYMDLVRKVDYSCSVTFLIIEDMEEQGLLRRRTRRGKEFIHLVNEEIICTEKLRRIFDAICRL